MNDIYYIIGIKHCGKSTVGLKISEVLKLPFVDLDDIVEKSINISVRDYYKKYGKDAFQNEEKLAIKTLKESYKNGFICATGGGICDNKQAFSILQKNGTKIFINTEFSTIYNRVIKNGIPPFLKTSDPEKEFLELYKKRTIKYKKIANIEINGTNKNPEEIRDEILNLIKE